MLITVSCRGVVIDGYISGSTLFFDANKNNVRDDNEPFTTTDSNGGFELEIPFDKFDTNKNGQLEQSEGNIVAVGGLGNDCLIGGAGSDYFLLSADSAIDTIVDFEDGKDLILLANGLTFAQLAVNQSNDATLIKLVSNGQVLASLTGVSANTISATDFGF